MSQTSHKTEGVNRTKTVRVYPFVFIANDEDLQWKADKLFKQSLDQVNHRVLGENDLNCIMHNKFSPEVLGEWIDGIPYHVRADVETEYWQFKEMVYSMLDDPNDGHEKEVFFYHSDHLGSASWITDGGGMAVQHIQYLPYGEPYINQRPFSYSERFTFTGNDPRKGWRIPLNEIKYNEQRDEETGFGYLPQQVRQAYHGARYMDHELMTMWLSVDPMADKYPSISPYAYCAWNPVKLKDPEGMEAMENDDGWKVDKKNKTIKNTSPIGGDNFHRVYGDDCYQFSGSTAELLANYDGYTVTNADGTQSTVANSGDGASQSSMGDKKLSAANNSIEGAAVGWRRVSNKDKYDILRKQHVKGQLEMKPGEAKRAVNSMTAKGSSKMRHCAGVGVTLSIVDLYENIYVNDNGSFGVNSAGSAGSAIGGWAGAKAGAILGAKAGIWFWPWGTIVGGIVGGVAGGIGGDMLGNSLGRSIYGIFQ